MININYSSLFRQMSVENEKNKHTQPYTQTNHHSTNLSSCQLYCLVVRRPILTDWAIFTNIGKHETNSLFGLCARPCWMVNCASLRENHRCQHWKDHCACTLPSSTSNATDPGCRSLSRRASTTCRHRGGFEKSPPTIRDDYVLPPP